MAKHRGRFKWKKYSRFKGNLRLYWEAKERMAAHRWEQIDETD